MQFTRFRKGFFPQHQCAYVCSSLCCESVLPLKYHIAVTRFNIPPSSIKLTPSQSIMFPCPINTSVGSAKPDITITIIKMLRMPTRPNFDLRETRVQGIPSHYQTNSVRPQVWKALRIFSYCTSQICLRLFSPFLSSIHLMTCDVWWSRYDSIIILTPSYSGHLISSPCSPSSAVVASWSSRSLTIVRYPAKFFASTRKIQSTVQTKMRNSFYTIMRSVSEMDWQPTKVWTAIIYSDIFLIIIQTIMN